MVIIPYMFRVYMVIITSHYKNPIITTSIDSMESILREFSVRRHGLSPRIIYDNWWCLATERCDACGSKHGHFLCGGCLVASTTPKKEKHNPGNWKSYTLDKTNSKIYTKTDNLCPWDGYQILTSSLERSWKYITVWRSSYFWWFLVLFLWVGRGWEGHPPPSNLPKTGRSTHESHHQDDGVSSLRSWNKL